MPVYDPTYPERYKAKYPILQRYKGYYKNGRSYGFREVVDYIGSVFESKIEDNTHVPATWDVSSGVVYYNEEFWNILVNETADYILYQEIKKLENKEQDQ